ncbi:hypothetical protein UVUMRFZT_CDS0204 [Staphylococcus phage LJLAME001]
MALRFPRNFRFYSTIYYYIEGTVIVNSYSNSRCSCLLNRLYPIFRYILRD